MAFILITNTGGAQAAVNPALAAGLVPVVVGASPITRIMLSTGAGETFDTVTPYIDVPLSVAATVAALAAGGAAFGVIAFCVVDGATGNLLPGIGGGVLSAARAGAGDYTVTLVAPPPANAAAGVSGASGTDAHVSTDGPTGLVTGVKTFNTAGAAADATFMFFVLATP